MNYFSENLFEDIPKRLQKKHICSHCHDDTKPVTVLAMRDINIHGRITKCGGYLCDRCKDLAILLVEGL